MSARARLRPVNTGNGTFLVSAGAAWGESALFGVPWTLGAALENQAPAAE